MFTGLFTTEILIRVVAMGPTAFVRVRWYLFDAAVVAASLMGYEYMLMDSVYLEPLEW